MSDIKEIRESVDRLYAYRDRYFENNPVDNALRKTDDTKVQMDEVIKLIEKHAESLADSPTYAMLKGKALNVLPSYSSEAHDCLTKAIKSDPKLVEAWNQLGECLWKKNDTEGARNAFLGALKQKNNKVSLRSLSMVLRQLGSTETERYKYVMEGVEKAKEAVQLDVQDGTSWFVLGNAYLSLFFNGKQDPAALSQCMQAYGQAEKDVIAKCNPDLHFNRAVALKHQEAYQEALEGFQRAKAFDPSWDMASQRENDLLDYIRKTGDLVNTKGHLLKKPKKIAQHLSKLSSTQLGPYGGGSYTSSIGKTVPLTQCGLKDLNEGNNREKVVLGKVLGNVPSSDPVQFTCALLDKEGNCCAVTVYNIGSGFGFKVGDSLAIPEPFLHTVTVNHNGQTITFPSIRVETPLILVVNGRKLGVGHQAPSVLTSQARSE